MLAQALTIILVNLGRLQKINRKNTTAKKKKIVGTVHVSSIDIV
jgi:hypothetical protein